MRAHIEGEDAEYIKLFVTDNNGAEHDLTIDKKTGKVEYHDQDKYPDKPFKRTFEENEHVAQAQRFAKFFVYRQRGYDTLSPLPNPDRIGAVAAVIEALSPEAFETYFGDYFQQMRSHFGKADSVVDVPEGATDHPLFFQKDVYLDLDVEDVRAFLTEADQETLEVLQKAAEATVDDDILGERLSALADEVDSGDRERLADDLVEAVSGVHLMWSPADNETETMQQKVPDIGRDPDARLELPPHDPGSLEDFRKHLVGHLNCQIRDCYLTMGIAPPKSVRVQGPGRFDRSTWFEHYDVYEPYHRDDVEITDWQEDRTPEEFL